MKRIYSKDTGVYLGLIWFALGAWHSEDRDVFVKRHNTFDDAVAHLHEQEQFEAVA